MSVTFQLQNVSGIHVFQTLNGYDIGIYEIPNIFWKLTETQMPGKLQGKHFVEKLIMEPNLTFPDKIIKASKFTFSTS